MKTVFRSSMVWGFLLILVGLALLAQNMFDLEIMSLAWAVGAGIFGIGFIYMAWKNPRTWWRWLAGAGLIGISLSQFLEFALPDAALVLDGAEVLGCLAVGFFLVYIFQRENWWAVIPGGVLATLSVTSLVESSGVGLENSSIFFLGLGLTFVLVALLPDAGQRWGFIPGGFMLALGLLLALQAGFLFDLLWPAGLILGGGYLIFRALRPSSEKPAS